MRTNSLRSFYESIVVLSWSTFETVAEDLWEAAVNARPGKLASGKIDVNDLKRERFDVRNKLGTLLKHVDNRSFRSLWDIQDAYEQTFTDQGTRIKELLSDPELQYSAAVRNVIIHKGGRIDGEYLKQVASVPAAFRGEPGEQFPLTGKITLNRSDVALITAAKLLKAVCRWIVGHPEK